MSNQLKIALAGAGLIGKRHAEVMRMLGEDIGAAVVATDAFFRRLMMGHSWSDLHSKYESISNFRSQNFR